MKVLIVDDIPFKAKALADCIKLYDSSIIPEYAMDAHSAFAQASSSRFDLVLLDVLLPLSGGEAPSEDGSVWFLREIHRKLGDGKLPLIVGTTKYADSLAKVESIFREYLWSIVYVEDSDDK